MEFLLVLAGKSLLLFSEQYREKPTGLHEATVAIGRKQQERLWRPKKGESRIPNRSEQMILCGKLIRMKCLLFFTDLIEDVWLYKLR